MFDMYLKPGCVLYVMLTLALLTGCRGNGGSQEAEPQNELLAIPFGVGQIKLTWPDSMSREHGFKIERTPDPLNVPWVEIVSVDSNVTSYVDDLKGIPAGERHYHIFYYRVRPSAGSEDVQYSNEAEARLPPEGMAAIPAGCFEMGDSFGDGAPDERPVHRVCLPAFYMDVHEVTNAEFEKCVQAAGCKLIGPSDDSFGDPKYEDYPSIAPYWEYARDYCTWAGKRLPTEAEWEYAARGGLKGKRYPRGDFLECGDANFGRRPPFINCKNFVGYCTDFNYAREGSPCLDFGGLENSEKKVGSYPANGYGLHDMEGNLMEWVNDYYSPDYYAGRPDPDNDPPGPVTNDEGLINNHVLRGGSWASMSPLLLRVSFRDSDPQLFSLGQIGIRCAADPRPEGE